MPGNFPLLNSFKAASTWQISGGGSLDISVSGGGSGGGGGWVSSSGKQKRYCSLFYDLAVSSNK